MAKFKKGDRVRCVNDRAMDIHVGNIYIVIDVFGSSIDLHDEDGCLRSRPEDRYELATPQPIPETVTIGGVEYVRKPEPDHVWAWGQWARVSKGGFKGLIVFVTGEVKSDGSVPVTYRDRIRGSNIDGFYRDALTYISTAIIPE